MTRSQVCKHQVCDYCSGRFGMVTHRWWGNKFCKRTCKNAYLHENDRTLSGWVIPRFLFAGSACLAAALAVFVLTLLLLGSANAAPSEEQPAAGVSLEFNKEDGTLYIDLSGPIVAGTADDVRRMPRSATSHQHRRVFLPAFAAWPAALPRPAPPATLAQRPTLN
jgi:hypothetical protein